MNMTMAAEIRWTLTWRLQMTVNFEEFSAVWRSYWARPFSISFTIRKFKVHISHQVQNNIAGHLHSVKHRWKETDLWDGHVAWEKIFHYNSCCYPSDRFDDTWHTLKSSGEGQWKAPDATNSSFYCDCCFPLSSNPRLKYEICQKDNKARERTAGKTVDKN